MALTEILLQMKRGVLMHDKHLSKVASYIEATSVCSGVPHGYSGV